MSQFITVNCPTATLTKKSNPATDDNGYKYFLVIIDSITTNTTFHNIRTNVSFAMNVHEKYCPELYKFFMNTSDKRIKVNNLTATIIGTIVDKGEAQIKVSNADFDELHSKPEVPEEPKDPNKPLTISSITNRHLHIDIDLPEYEEPKVKRTEEERMAYWEERKKNNPKLRLFLQY